MGLRGPGAIRRLNVADKVRKTRRKRRFPWKAKGLSRVARIVKFLEWLPVTKGICVGKRMKLLPNQKKFIADVYGSTRKDGRRLVTLGIQSEPKGNGKTGLVAGLCLCHLFGPEQEPRGEIYSAAIDRKQAGIVFNEMEAIIFKVPEFAERCNIQRFHKKIEDLESGSIYESLSSDARSAHGLAPSLWVYDELAQEQNRDLLDNLMQGMSKRKESLGLIISTQAPVDDHPLSELIDDGLTSGDPRVVVQLTEAPKDADIFNLNVLKACNPAWGKFLDLDDLMEKRDRAMRMPSLVPAFRNLRGNQRVDARTEKRLVTNEVWQRGKGAVLRKKLKGATCYGGLDLSGKHDLTAFVLVFPDESDPPGYDILPFFWTPLGQLETRKPAEKKLFKLWIEQRFLIGVPGEVIDYGFVAGKVAELLGEFNIEAIGYDRWRIDDFKSELKKVGVEDDDPDDKEATLLQPFGQGFKDMAPAVEYFAECALQSRLRHGGNPVLTSSVANCIVVSDPAGNQKFDKGKSNKSGSVRIDGAVATVMALGTAKRRLGVEKPPSIDEFLANPVMVV
jgi:phage terminase large subunit-like protein